MTRATRTDGRAGRTNRGRRAGSGQGAGSLSLSPDLSCRSVGRSVVRLGSLDGVEFLLCSSSRSREAPSSPASLSCRVASRRACGALRYGSPGSGTRPGPCQAWGLVAAPAIAPSAPAGSAPPARSCPPVVWHPALASELGASCVSRGGGGGGVAVGRAGGCVREHRRGSAPPSLPGFGPGPGSPRPALATAARVPAGRPTGRVGGFSSRDDRLPAQGGVGRELSEPASGAGGSVRDPRVRLGWAWRAKGVRAGVCRSRRSPPDPPPRRLWRRVRWVGVVSGRAWEDWGQAGGRAGSAGPAARPPAARLFLRAAVAALPLPLLHVCVRSVLPRVCPPSPGT